jgi:ABC-type glycerol-3-phosphate transport system substrate-binding protein
LEPSSLAGIRSMSKGGVYALPLIINTAVLYYNKDIFDKMALPNLKDNMGWDEVINLARRAQRQEGGIDYLGIRNGMQPHGNLNPMSLPFIDPATEKPTIMQDERWKTIFSQLIEMRKTMNNTTASFVREPKVAMSADLANIFLNNDMTMMNWDMVTYPQDPGFPDRGAQPLPTLFGISSTSKFKDEAMLVLKHLLSEEVQLDYSKRAVIPALQDQAVLKQFATQVVYKDTVYKDKNFQAIVKKKFAPIPPKTSYETMARQAYEKPLSDLTKGVLDINTAFRQIDEELTKQIAERKGNK